MLRILVDINLREDHRTIAILPENVLEKELNVGARVILYEPGMECEAILRHGEIWKWVADIVEGTVKEIPVDQQRISGKTGSE
jgi:hypothetical protein